MSRRRQGSSRPRNGETRRTCSGFSGAKATVVAKRKVFNFRYRSPQHFVDVFRDYYGPVLKAFEAIDAQKRPALEADLLDLLNRLNVAKDGTLVVPSEYLEAVIAKKS